MPRLGIAALSSGEIDYYPGMGPGVAGMLQGVPIKVVACYVPSAPFALIARPEFQSVQQLREGSRTQYIRWQY